MLGVDGGHSWVFQQLGLSIEGKSTGYVWGVLSVYLSRIFQTFVWHVRFAPLTRVRWSLKILLPLVTSSLDYLRCPAYAIMNEEVVRMDIFIEIFGKGNLFVSDIATH
ncbi:hypothetical protein BJY04DRAFT_194226 [Aspergillus karnatakaensis]|uniref:uncharacterized protein n=1 Tax=Aspergillus karnatakaensis TaxID=1810916 RepID=UPI003CCD4899